MEELEVNNGGNGIISTNNENIENIVKIIDTIYVDNFKRNVKNEHNIKCNKYKMNELMILNNYIQINRINIRSYHLKINRYKYCTTLYIGKSNYYYGIDNTLKGSKLNAAKNCLKYNNDIRNYAKIYEK